MGILVIDESSDDLMDRSVFRINLIEIKNKIPRNFPGKFR